jgi:probable phosphomutase (TIGR03848 family)
MTTLFLIRHATTAATGTRLGGRTQASLDERGRNQATAAASRLADVPFAALYASPLPRTTETAQLIAEPHRLDVLPCEGVLEVDYGRWTDRPLKQVARTKLWPVIQARPSLVEFPDGETIRDAQLRAITAIEEIVARHKGKVVGVVSHADLIKAVVSFYLGQPLDLFQRIMIAPASATVLQLSPGGRPALLRLNDDGPMEAERFRPPPKAGGAKAGGSKGGAKAGGSKGGAKAGGSKGGRRG